MVPILGFSIPAESSTGNELDLHLENAIRTYKEAKIKMNKKTNLAFTFFGIGFAILIELLSDTIKIPQTGLSIDAEVAMPVFLFLGSFTFFLRTVDLVSVLFTMKKVQHYYRARFHSEIDVSVLGSPSPINLFNWAMAAGWIGRIIMLVPCFLYGGGMVFIIISKNTVMDISSFAIKLIYAAGGITLISTIAEPFTGRFANYLIKYKSPGK
ncbi:MAG TPA: hypothetical protein DCP28_34780 [Cytophagales bacterium]|nr:hypothetical protein [Cytophagales bacterium]